MLCPLGVFIVNYLRTSIVTKNVDSSGEIDKKENCYIHPKFGIYHQ